jgi:DNA-binding MarR family transcriptional regulator
MTEAAPSEELSHSHGQILLELLDSVERDSKTSQRRLAADLGVAVGLVNAYIKRCVKMGLIKASQAPARRYAYYLTPKGFVEKSRLTVEYLSYSFSFFRQARSDCANLLGIAHARGLSRVVLAGISDFAEITIICALDAGIEVVGLVDHDATVSRYVGVPVFKNYSAVDKPFDAVVITDLKHAAQAISIALTQFRSDRVLVPQLLGVRVPDEKNSEEVRHD